MSIEIKYKITDNVSDAVWLATLILTYEQKSNFNSIVFKQSKIRKVAQSLCHKIVQSARVYQWCNGDNQLSTYNYLREVGAYRRLTRMGEFNGQKEYPSNISELIKIDTKIIIYKKSVTIKELFNWYVNIYSKNERFDDNESLKDEKGSIKKRNISIKFNDVIIDFEKMEKYYRQLCSDALNIKNIDESKQIIDDSFEKVRKINEWKDIIVSLNEEISNSTIVIDTIGEEDDNNPQEYDDDNFDEDHEEKIDKDIFEDDNLILEDDIDDEDDNLIQEDDIDESEIEEILADNQNDDPEKIGAYIRKKMLQLSTDGHTFDKETLTYMSSYEWSKATFNIGVPFIRIYKEDKYISEQVCDDFGYSRYWNETFEFGNIKLLITSQWYERHRSDFNKWYNLQLELMKLKEFNNLEDQDDELDEMRLNGIAQDYRNTTPVNIIFLNKKYNVDNWKDVLVKVCELMILKKPYRAAGFNIERSLKGKTRTNFSYNESDIKYSGKKLSNGLWVETNRSANSIYHFAVRILELCGFKEQDLTINVNE